MSKPWVYVSSPYTLGDVALNVRFQCEIFDELIVQGVVPIIPLWSHFQHLMFPRSYEDWMGYDMDLIERCDACLRLPAKSHDPEYYQYESNGADREVARFKELGKPVFTSLGDFYEWLENQE